MACWPGQPGAKGQQLLLGEARGALPGLGVKGSVQTPAALPASGREGSGGGSPRCFSSRPTHPRKQMDWAEGGTAPMNPSLIRGRGGWHPHPALCMV